MVHPFWLTLVLVGVPIMFVASVLFSARKLQIFLGTALTFVVLGQATGWYPTTLLFSKLHEAINLVLIIGGLQVLSSLVMDSGIVDWGVKAIATRKLHPIGLEILFLVVTYVVSLGLNNLAAMLIIIPFILDLRTVYTFDTRWFLPGLIIASNLGGASTLIGDFPNITIGLATGASFLSFLYNMGIPVFVLLLAFFVIYGVIRLPDLRKLLGRSEYRTPAPVRAAREYYRWLPVEVNRKDCLVGVILFASMLIVLIVWQVPAVLIVCVFGALALILGGDSEARLKNVDVGVMLLFISLFVIAGAIESTTIFDLAKNLFSGRQPTGPFLICLFIAIIAAIITAIVSAGPSTALLIPLARYLDQLSPGGLVWWSLSLGVLAGSSATVIGATAGPVTAALVERQTNGEVTMPMGGYMRLGFPVACIFLVISAIIIWLKS